MQFKMWYLNTMCKLLYNKCTRCDLY